MYTPVVCKAEAMVIKMKNDTDRRLSKSDYFICGAFAGFAESFVEGPIDLVCTALYPLKIYCMLNLIRYLCYILFCISLKPKCKSKCSHQGWVNPTFSTDMSFTQDG